jgi:recombination DNA repair RAD52 pathway protein
MQLISGISRLFLSSIEAVQNRAASMPEGVAMTLDDDLLFSDDLPVEARLVLEDAEKKVSTIRKTVADRSSQIQEAADRRIADIKKEAERETTLLQANASRELSPLVRELFNTLKAMQANCMKEGKLDEALAVRNRLRAMRSDLFGVKQDPGNMTDFGSSDYGKTFLYEIVGSNDGNCWGMDYYTADSRVAVAAVHAGAVRIGERAIVRVSLSDGSERVFDGCERYGIRSLDYGNYSLAFSVERV